MKKIRLISLLSLLSSLMIFLALLVWMYAIGTKAPLYQTLSNIWLGDIFIGVISFISVISLHSKAKHGKTDSDIKQVFVEISFWSWLSSIVFFVLFLIVMIVKGWTVENYIVGRVIASDIAFGVISCITFFVSVILTRSHATVKKRSRFSTRKFALVVLSIFILFVFVPRIISGHYLRVAQAYYQKGELQKAIETYKKAKSALSVTIFDNSEMDSIDKKISSVNQTIPVPTSTSTPVKTPTATQKNAATIIVNPTIDPDPPVHCKINEKCGGGTTPLKLSECNNSTCCGFTDGTWKFYKDKNQCTKDQGGKVQSIVPYNPNPNPNNYPPCTIYYPALGYSQTYNSISPEMCQSWKNNITNTTTQIYVPESIVLPTVVAIPTTNPACAEAKGLWQQYKEDFMVNQYPHFSSSAEAIKQLESDRQTVQAQLNSYGCNVTLSL